MSRVTADDIVDMNDIVTNREILLTLWSPVDVAELAATLLAFAGQADDLHEAYEGEELFSEYHTEMRTLLMDGPKF